MMLMPLLTFTAGLVLLVAGAEVLVRGAVALSNRLGIPPLIVGLTVVGFGTSAPELVVSLTAALDNNPGIAIGNVVGSNIANVLLILGATALVYPVPFVRAALTRDTGIMLAATVVLVAVAWLGSITRPVGGLFLLMLGTFIVTCYRAGQQDPAAAAMASEAEEMAGWARFPTPVLAALVAVGLAVLIGGGHLMVSGAVVLAQIFGVPDSVIGLTVVALGTSLPELAASITAAIKRHTDVAVGNIIGSNIFNVFMILGTTAVIQPIPVPAEVLVLDVWVMLAAALALAALVARGQHMGRMVGIAFLAFYAGYVTWLFVAGMPSTALS